MSVASGEKTAKQLQAELGVTPSAVSLWKRQLLGEGDSPNMVKKHPKEPEKDSTQQNVTLRAECDNLREEMNKLQTQVYRLQMEKDILQKAAEILKKDEGIGIDKLSNKEKAMIIDALKGRYPLKDLLHSLSMAKSSYFYQNATMQKISIHMFAKT